MSLKQPWGILQSVSDPDSLASSVALVGRHVILGRYSLGAAVYGNVLLSVEHFEMSHQKNGTTETMTIKDTSQNGMLLNNTKLDSQQLYTFVATDVISLKLSNPDRVAKFKFISIDHVNPGHFHLIKSCNVMLEKSGVHALNIQVQNQNLIDRYAALSAAFEAKDLELTESKRKIDEISGNMTKSQVTCDASNEAIKKVKGMMADVTEYLKSKTVELEATKETLRGVEAVSQISDVLSAHTDMATATLPLTE